MSLPPFDSSAQSIYTQPPNPTWTYGQRVDATPEGKAWVSGESEGWKVYNTAETDKGYVLPNNYPLHTQSDRQNTIQAPDLRHCTPSDSLRVHDKRAGHRKPLPIQVMSASII